jgi:hypothetical protein
MRSGGNSVFEHFKSGSSINIFAFTSFKSRDLMSRDILV